MTEEILEKTCSTCGETKPVSKFHKRKVSKDGYRGQCIKCKQLSDHSYNCERRDQRVRSQRVGILRRCKVCGVTKDLSQFRKRGDAIYGHAYKCKECSTKIEWENYKAKFEK